MRRLAGPAIVALLVAGWFVTLRPATLGGPAAYVIVSGQSMQPTLTPGSLVVGHRRAIYEVGDVIIYRIPKGMPGTGTRVIHRIVGGSADAGYVTRGDNRQDPDRWRPRPHEVEGVKLVAVPGVGRAMMLLASPLVLGGLAALLACLSFDDSLLARRRRRPHAAAPAHEPVFAGPVPPATVLSMPWLGSPEPASAAPRVEAAPVLGEPAALAPVVRPVVHPAPAAAGAAHIVRRRRRGRAHRRRVLATSGAVAGCVGVGLLVSRAGRR